MKIGAGAVLVLFLCFRTASVVLALDWKTLHTEADERTSLGAFLKSPGRQDSIEQVYVQGLVYLNEHKDKEAGDAFQKMLAFDPGSLEARWGKAEVFRRMHRLDESESLLKQIIGEKKDFAPALVSMAYVQYIRGNFNQSVDYALAVVDLGEEHVDTMNYARAYLLVGGGRGIIAHYGGPVSKLVNGTRVLPNLKKAEQLKPDAPGVLFGLGSFYLLAPSLIGGNLEQAIIYLERAVKSDPPFADAYVRLSQAYKRKGDAGKSEFYLKKAFEIDPENELAVDVKTGTCKFICP